MNLRKFIKNNLLCLALLANTLLIQAGCSGFRKKNASEVTMSDVTKKLGQWESKLIVEDLKQNKIHSLNLDVIAEYMQRMRLEITGTLGVNVASVVVLKDTVKYSLHTQKKYFEGPASDKSFSAFIKGALDPRWFYAVFFDRPIDDKNWNCKMNSKLNLVESCFRLSDRVQLIWLDRVSSASELNPLNLSTGNNSNALSADEMNKEKKILIQGEGFRVTIVVTDLKTNVQILDKTFQIKIPDSYTQYKIY